MQIDDKFKINIEKTFEKLYYKSCKICKKSSDSNEIKNSSLYRVVIELIDTAIKKVIDEGTDLSEDEIKDKKEFIYNTVINKWKELDIFFKVDDKLLDFVALQKVTEKAGSIPKKINS